MLKNVQCFQLSYVKRKLIVTSKIVNTPLVHLAYLLVRAGNWSVSMIQTESRNAIDVTDK